VGFTILGSACLSVFINIKGRSALFQGEATIVSAKPLTIPEAPSVDDENSVSASIFGLLICPFLLGILDESSPLLYQ
jgi:hypothetical protein